LPLISAENIGTYKLNQPMEITNYCQSGTCSYITLISLEFPNGTITYPMVNMTSSNNKSFNYSFTPDLIGEYTFTTCGDSSIVVCDSDSFNVTYTGKDTFSGINIILLIFFISLLIGVVWLNHKIDYKKWYENILKKYEHKNYVKITLSSIAYNLMKNTFGIYYLFGFPIILIITDIILTYNIESLIGLATNFIYIYAWGFILVGVMFIGQLQEFIVTILEDFNSIQWGMRKNE
jgi:hypothetical protein